MIHIEASITEQEMQRLNNAPQGKMAAMKALLKTKGFFTFGGSFFPRLCGGIQWEQVHESKTVFFTQVLHECPSKKDLELNDPRNWPDHCPTMKGKDNNMG